MYIRYFDTLESTNKYCKLLDPERVEEFTVICARSQTAGIGQQGNVWTSEPGANLTFSLVLKPLFLAAADQYQLTMMLAVAVADTVAETVAPQQVHIKWPNDIYVGSKKICGILTSSQIHGEQLSYAICGVGLNVNQTHFPEWVPNPTSLKLLTRQTFDTDVVLHRLLDNIQKAYETLQSAPTLIRQHYLDQLFRMGQKATYIIDGKPTQATIGGVDRYGHLELTTADGAHITRAMKEIQYII